MRPVNYSFLVGTLLLIIVCLVLIIGILVWVR
jgi:hypothetical protein